MGTLCAPLGHLGESMTDANHAKSEPLTQYELPVPVFRHSTVGRNRRGGYPRQVFHNIIPSYAKVIEAGTSLAVSVKIQLTMLQSSPADSRRNKTENRLYFALWSSGRSLVGPKQIEGKATFVPWLSDRQSSPSHHLHLSTSAFAVLKSTVFQMKRRGSGGVFGRPFAAP